MFNCLLDISPWTVYLSRRVMAQSSEQYRQAPAHNNYFLISGRSFPGLKNKNNNFRSPDIILRPKEDLLFARILSFFLEVKPGKYSQPGSFVFSFSQKSISTNNIAWRIIACTIMTVIIECFPQYSEKIGRIEWLYLKDFLQNITLYCHCFLLFTCNFLALILFHG